MAFWDGHFPSPRLFSVSLPLYLLLLAILPRGLCVVVAKTAFWPKFLSLFIPPLPFFLEFLFSDPPLSSPIGYLRFFLF